MIGHTLGMYMYTCLSHTYIVIGVEDSCDVFCQVAIQHSLNVVAMVDWKK